MSDVRKMLYSHCRCKNFYSELPFEMSQFLFLAAPAVASICIEEFYLKKILPKLFETEHLFSRAYSAVILINVVASSFLITSLGFNVAQARRICKEEAEVLGDKDAEARFSYPKLYAEGFSEPAQKFNCVQRAHQHALETFPQFLALSVVGGIRFPLTSAVSQPNI
jgi:hypothetical protein